MTVQTLDAATTQELSPSVKSWLAENLALGRHRDQIRTVLVDGGVPEALAERELDAAESHPYLHAMKRCVVLLNKRESLLKTLDYYRRYDPGHLHVERTPLPPFADFLRDHLSVNRPGLFSGGFDHWPARHWTPRTMLDLVGADTAVEVEAGREGDPRHMQNGDRLRRTMRFAEFVDHVEDGRGNDVYMTANSFVLDSKPFAFVHEQVGNLGDGYLADTSLEKSMFLWMGPAGIVTGMHQDLNHILFCQIHGRKRFRLYPAMQVPYVYNRKWVFSPVDPLRTGAVVLSAVRARDGAGRDGGGGRRALYPDRVVAPRFRRNRQHQHQPHQPRPDAEPLHRVSVGFAGSDRLMRPAPARLPVLITPAARGAESHPAARGAEP